MKSAKNSRWQRGLAARRKAARQILLIGAVIGLTASLVMQQVVASKIDHSGSIALVRFSLIFPAALFVTWWLIGPGVTLTRDDEVAEQAGADDLAIDRDVAINQIFERFAAPAARNQARSSEREWYRSSLRLAELHREATTPGDADSWGLGSVAAANRSKNERKHYGQ